MKIRWEEKKILLLFISLLFISQGFCAHHTLIDYFKTEPRFSTLNQQIERIALLKQTLSDQTKNFTFLAPTNDAFNKTFDFNDLDNILLSLIKDGKLVNSSLKDGSLYSSTLYLPPLNKTQYHRVTSNSTGVFVSNVQLSEAAIDMGSSVVYPISILPEVPRIFSSLLSSVEKFSNFTYLLNQTDLLSLFDSAEGTAFVLTDSVFSELPNDNLFSQPLNDADRSAVRDYLLGHFSQEFVYGGKDISTKSITTLSNQTNQLIEISSKESEDEIKLTANGIKSSYPNVIVKTGVVHVFSALLIPLPPLSIFGNDNMTNSTELTLIEKLKSVAKLFGSELENSTFLNDLNSNTSCVIFAPSDSVFEEGKLSTLSFVEKEKILKYHIVTPNINLTTLEDGIILLPTLLTSASLDNAAQPLRLIKISNETFVNGSRLIDPISAFNATIYLIDRVLNPPSSLLTVLKSHQNFTEVSQLIDDNMFMFALNQGNADIESDNDADEDDEEDKVQYTERDTILAGKNLTVFLPTDEGWKKLSPEIRKYLLLDDDEARQDLKDILFYHLVGETDSKKGPYYLKALRNSTELTQRNMLRVNVSIGNESSSYSEPILNGGSRIVLPDILTENGVLQGLNQTLLPPRFNFTILKSLKSVNAEILLNAIKKTGFEEVLNSFANYTIFAPNDDALDHIGGELGDILDDDNQVYLQQEKTVLDFLKLHVVNYSIETLVSGNPYYPLLPNYVFVASSDAKKLNLFNTSYYSSMKPTLEIVPITKDFQLENEKGTAIGTNQSDSANVLSRSFSNRFVVYELDSAFILKETPKGKGSYGWLVMIIGMIVLVTIGLIGYYFYRRRQALSSDVRLLD